MRRVIVPSAFKQIKLKPTRKFAPVGRLAAETGWKYQDVVANLEAKRQANAQTYWDNKQKALVSICTKGAVNRYSEKKNFFYTFP